MKNFYFYYFSLSIIKDQMMDKRMQILMFYIALILAAMFTAWFLTKSDSDRMVNTLAAAVVGSGASLMLWTTYGQFMNT